MKNIYSSIDIGSDNIKLIVCELYNNKLNLLATSSVKSKGIKKGIITNPEETMISIRQAFQEVESMLGLKVHKVIASIPSSFADFTYVHNDIAIENEDSIVTSDDIVRLLQNAIESKIKPGQEMVTIIPVDFKLDETTGIGFPLGLIGRNLSTRAIMVSTPKKNIYSVVAILEKMGIEVVDIMINGIGEINTFKNKDILKQTGAIVNIGAEVTTISLYNKGIIVNNSVIGIGGKSIDNDLSYMYKISPVEAQRLKEKFALAYKKYASPSETYEIVNATDEELKITQYDASEIVMARLEEILDLIKKELNVLSNKDLQYIIVTGGTSNITNLEYLLEEYFGKIACVGNIKVIGLRNNIYSACLGNIVYFINKLKLRGNDYSMISGKDMEELSSVRKNTANISSESMLGKVFGYFFGE